MFLAWSKQLENEGMGSRIGVSSFFMSITFFYTIVYAQNIWFFLILDYSLHSSES